MKLPEPSKRWRLEKHQELITSLFNKIWDTDEENGKLAKWSPF